MKTKNLNEISELLTSLRELKWETEWFNSKKVDDDLITNIKSFQEVSNLPITGLISPETYRLIYNLKKHQTIKNKKIESIDSKQFIHGKNHYHCRIPLSNYLDNPFLKPTMSCYDSFEDHRTRELTKIVIINDYCLNSETDLLLSKHLNHSSHFQIDNDGKIYQNLNLHYIPYNRLEYLTVDERIIISVSNAVLEDFSFWYSKNNINKEIFKNKLKITDKQDFSLNQLIDALYKYFPIQSVKYC